jgi:methyl-accepting chemotaxis protein
VKFATDITASFKGQQLEAAVRETRDVIARAKNKDLTGRIALDGKSGEIAELCSGVNDLIDTMASVVGSVREISGRIDSASAKDLLRQRAARRAHGGQCVEPAGDGCDDRGTGGLGQAQRR